MITVKTENIPTSPTQKPRQNTPIYDPAIIYILEFCTVLALRSQDTVELLGKRVGNALHAILRDASRYHPILVERTAFYLFHLLQASYDFDYIRVPIVLHTVSSFSKELLINTSALVLRGLKLCIEKPSPLRNEIMTSPDFWVILRVLAAHPDSSAVVFEILESGITGTPSAIMADNYEEVLSLLNDFATMAHVGSVAEQKADKKSGRKGRPAKQEKPRYIPLSSPSRQLLTPTSENAVVTRGIKAIHHIYQLTSRIPHLMKQSHLESNEGEMSSPHHEKNPQPKLTHRKAWSAYWLPIFQALTTQCTNPCREVRHLAFASMQRSLLSPELTSADHEEWTAIFGEVLFPLILRLLKPEVFSSDRDGMSETRVQAASLLCKVFLQYLVILSKWEGMLDLWLRVIEIMDRLMNSGQGDSLVRFSWCCVYRTVLTLWWLGGGRPREPQERSAHHVEQRLSGAAEPEPRARGAVERDVEAD